MRRGSTAELRDACEARREPIGTRRWRSACGLLLAGVAAIVPVLAPAGAQIAGKGGKASPLQEEYETVDDRLVDAGGSASTLVASDAGLFYGFATINGRELSSDENQRDADFKAFPLPLSKDRLVYRFARADDIEGALFGTLETKTIEPLSLKKRRIDLEARTLFYPYADRAHQGPGKRFSASYIDQFDTGIGRIGISAGVLYRQLPQPREYYESGTNAVPCNSVGASGACSYDPKSGNPLYYAGPTGTFRQERVDEKLNGLFGSVQWQPSDRWDMVFDLEHSRRITTRYRNELGLSNTETNVTPLAIGPQGQLLRWSGTSALDLNAFRRRRDERYTGTGLTTRFHATDRLTLSTDLSYQRTFRVQDDTSATLGSNSSIGPGGQISYTADQSSTGFSSIDFATPIDLNNYANYTVNPADRRGHETHVDQIWAARFDATYKLGGFFQSLRAGVRYSVHRRDADLHTYTTKSGTVSAANAAAGMAGCRIPTIISDFAAQTITNIRSWAMYDPTCLFDAFAGVTSPNDATLSTLSGGGVHVREQVAAGYVMGSFGGTAAAMPFNGNVGLRVVETDSSTRVYRYTSNPADLGGVSDTVGPVVDLLPSLNLAASPTSRLHVQAGAGRVLLRSNIEGLDLRRILQGPATTVDIGRPRPTTSWNLDLVFHYRIAKPTTLMLAFSDKFLSSSLWPGDVLIPGGPLLPSWLVGLTSRGSYIRSVEVGIDQRFTMLPKPFDAITLKASYLYTGSNFRFADPTAFNKAYPLYLFTPPAGVPAISKHAIAISSRYARGPFQMGVSYEYRSGYFRPTGLTPNRFLAPSTRLALNAAYDLTKHIQLSALAANLTNQSDSFVRPIDGSVGQTPYTGQVYSLGVRFRM